MPSAPGPPRARDGRADIRDDQFVYVQRVLGLSGQLLGFHAHIRVDHGDVQRLVTKLLADARQHLIHRARPPASVPS